MRDLSVGNERRLIFQFAMPMLIGNVFQQLYNVVDSAIVGNFIGKEALAAVGSSFPIIFTLMSLLIGVAIGATIVIAQYFGAKDMVNVKRSIDTLYIFLHMPKCAGTTVRHHIENNFDDEQILRFYNSKQRKLTKEDFYRRCAENARAHMKSFR